MAWTAPRTWVSSEVVTAALMNTHMRDNLLWLGRVGVDGWSSWTPAITASTDPTLGSGSSVSGKYAQVGRLVAYWAHVQFGTSGTNAGSGTYEFSLPVNNNNTTDNVIGGGTMFDSGPNTRYVCALERINAAEMRMIEAVSKTTVSSSTPFTPAASDVYKWWGVYESAS